MRNRISAILLITGLAALLFCALFSLKSEDKSKSEVENRALSQMPLPDRTSVLDGTFGRAYEQYSLDQFAFREQALSRYFGIENDLGVKERNGFINAGSSFYFEVPRIFRELPSKQYLLDYSSSRADVLEILQSAGNPEGTAVISLQIPHKTDFYYDKYPVLYPYNREYYTAMQEALDRRIMEQGIALLDVAPVMEEKRDEYLYFRSDNHYTFRGAYYTYRALLDYINENFGESLKFPDWDDCEYFREKGRFVGSYLRKFGDDGRPTEDYLEYVMPYDMPEYKRYENGKESKLNILNMASSGYTRFMGGDKANTVIVTDRPELPSILYIGHSYSNALELLSIYSFNEMHSIDPRYYDGNLSEYIRTHDIDYVVVLRNELYEGNRNHKASVR